MNCPLCQQPIQENAAFCAKCGKKIPRCPTCGTVILPGAKFCNKDGTKVPDEVLALFAAKTSQPATQAQPAPRPQPAPQTQPAPKPQPAPQAPRPAAPQPAPQKPKKSAGKGLTIFLIVILILAVLIGGVFALHEFDVIDLSFIDDVLGTEFFIDDSDDDDDDDDEDEGNDKSGLPGKDEEEADQNAQQQEEPTQSTEAEPVVTYEYRYEIIKGNVSWSEAKAACEAKGGYLATINSAEEYATICALADDSGLTYLWLGANLPAGTTQWKWSTGEEIPLENYYWYRNGDAVEPSYMDKSDGVREDCLCMWNLSSGGYKWTLNDQRNNLVDAFPSVSGKIGYVCEYKIEVRQ